MILRSVKAIDEKARVIFDETENPVLREWARNDNWELNNPIPNRRERSHFSSSIEKGNSQVLELLLMNAREQAIMSPIRMVPPEILSRIFVEADQTDNTDAVREAIMTCCRKWRQIGLGTPSFWSNIRLYESHCGPNSPLRCSLLATRTHRTLALAGRSKLDITGSIRHCHSNDVVNCDVIELLSKQGPQIRSIKSPDDTGSRILISAHQADIDLSNLVCLETLVYGEMWPGHRGSWPSKLSGLQSLMLYGYPLHKVLTTACPLLVTLVLGMDGLQGRLQPFLAFLGTLPTLQSLTGCSVREMALDNVHAPTETCNTELLLPNLVYLSMSTRIYYSDPGLWAHLPGNIILAASPKVSDLEIVLDEEVTPEAPRSPLSHVTRLTFKVKYSKMPRHHPPLTLKGRIHKWLDVFPAVSHLHVMVDPQIKSRDFMYILLNPSVKRDQPPFFPSLVDLNISEAYIDLKRLFEFSRSRSLVTHGGVLSLDQTGSVECHITTSKCRGIPEVVSGTFNEIFAAAQAVSANRAQ